VSIFMITWTTSTKTWTAARNIAAFLNRSAAVLCNMRIWLK